MRIWTCCLLGFSPTSVGFSNFTRNSISNVRVAGIILLFAITVVLYKKTCTRLQVQTLQEALLQAEAVNTSSTQVHRILRELIDLLASVGVGSDYVGCGVVCAYPCGARGVCKQLQILRCG